MSENYWASDSINISQTLYEKLNEIAQKRFGYTGRGIISDLVEEIIQSYVDKSKVRFLIKKEDRETPYRYEVAYIVTSVKPEDKDNDFVGVFFDLKSKESLLQIAKDAYGISEDEIEFLN